MLAERFNMKFHWEARLKPRYALVVDKGGAKLGAPTSLQPAPDRSTLRMAAGRFGPFENTFSNNKIHSEFASMTMPWLAEFLSQFVDLPVTDQTHISGYYRISIDVSMGDMIAANGGAPLAAIDPLQPESPDADLADSLLGASLKRLGLRLLRQKGSLNVFVIDHIERPSPN
jgi:uncharacterized protein (TIGR03435 family)